MNTTHQRPERRALILGHAALAILLSACEPAAEHDAKNVILFIGDGMGVSTVTAARIFDGQSMGKSGEEHLLEFEKFPHLALVKTYNSNQQVPDSAGTATAMMTGEKTRAGVINIRSTVQRNDCKGAMNAPLKSLGEIAKEAGKAVGFATTTRVTHATPATVYAHAPERDWETSWFVSEADWASGCRDIAHQLVNFSTGGGLDVALGGGRAVFLGNGRGGTRREPYEDLVDTWLEGEPNRRFVSTADELANANVGETVLGLFSHSHMTYVAEREATSTEPTLTDMTVKALELLSGNDNGYFLLVEGGRIDHGHHDGKPGYALLEAQEFNRAIATALQQVDLEETLVLVTADHSHVFTIGGYPTRGNPILGLVVGNDRSGEPASEPTMAADGQPYTTLAYANGPGAVTALPRSTPDTGVGALVQALIPTDSMNIDGSVTVDETHGGEDVALYAIGTGADRVSGVIEQNRIFDIMTQALGWNVEQ